MAIYIVWKRRGEERRKTEERHNSSFVICEPIVSKSVYNLSIIPPTSSVVKELMRGKVTINDKNSLKYIFF